MMSNYGSYDQTTPLASNAAQLEAGTLCTSTFRHPYDDPTRGPFPISSIHNQAFNYGVQAMTVIWYILVPLTVPAVFFAGMFVAGWSLLVQSVAWKSWCGLVGEIVGRMVVAISGKQEYYEKKMQLMDYQMTGK